MGQQEIMEFLDSHPGKKFRTADISAKTGLSRGSVTMSLKKLRNSGFIQFSVPGQFPNSRRGFRYWVRA